MTDVTPTVTPMQTKEIPLSQGLVAIVSASDYEFLMQWKWYAYKPKNSSTYYAQRTTKLDGRRTNVQMHRVILGVKKGIKVDHRNGNGLNNTRENLRPCTHSENMRNSQISRDNTSGYRGVTWHKGDRKWQAQIGINGKNKYLGSFHDPTEAARVHDVAARELHGEFARTNFE